MIGHHLDGVVGSQETVFDAVDPGADTGPDGGVADGVRGHPHPGAVGFVGDRGEFVRPNTAGRPGPCCAT